MTLIKTSIMALATCLFCSCPLAQQANIAETSVLQSIMKYWEARNAGDWDAAFSMESTAGLITSQSDGSFHKPLGWKRDFSGQAVNLNVYYPEATEISPGVVYARYYVEGLIGAGSERYQYRGRITNVWIREGQEWRMRGAHFSDGNYGRTRRTLDEDFN